MDKEIAATLNAEGFVAARSARSKVRMSGFCGHVGASHLEINGTSANPDRCQMSYSVQIAAAARGVTPQTVFDYLAGGWLEERQPTEGQPWQIEPSDERINTLWARTADRPRQAIKGRGRIMTTSVRRTHRPFGKAAI